MTASGELPSGGAYTSVGNYDLDELIEVVVRLSALTGTEVSEFVRKFGVALFGLPVTVHRELLDSGDDPFDVLRGIDTHI